MKSFYSFLFFFSFLISPFVFSASGASAEECVVAVPVADADIPMAILVKASDPDVDEEQVLLNSLPSGLTQLHETVSSYYEMKEYLSTRLFHLGCKLEKEKRDQCLRVGVWRAGSLFYTATSLAATIIWGLGFRGGDEFPFLDDLGLGASFAGLAVLWFGNSCVCCPCTTSRLVRRLCSCEDCCRPFRKEPCKPSRSFLAINKEFEQKSKMLMRVENIIELIKDLYLQERAGDFLGLFYKAYKRIYKRSEEAGLENLPEKFTQQGFLNILKAALENSDKLRLDSSDPDGVSAKATKSVKALLIWPHFFQQEAVEGG